MVRYVMLLQFTDKGIAEIKDSSARAESFRATVAQAGGTVEGQFWTEGEHDGVIVLTTPNETMAAALALDVSRHGFVRTRLMRAFDAAEFRTIVTRLS